MAYPACSSTVPSQTHRRYLKLMRLIVNACRRVCHCGWYHVRQTPSRSCSTLTWTRHENIQTLDRRIFDARARTVNTGSRRCYSATLQNSSIPTIYALSSAPGRAAIAVIRLSGPACLDVYHSLCPNKRSLKPRTASVRTLYEPLRTASSESILDAGALLLYFPAPYTVTGEDVLELHVHGGPAIVKAVLAAIAKCGDGGQRNLRYAEPGEFTRRAFMNGRLDLTQVEALSDTLAADTEQQRRISIRGTSGILARQYEKWRQQLLYARGELEALIDFSEDQHFDDSPADLCASVAQQVVALRRVLQVHSQNAVRGELLRHGISLSLLGAPNAGKSSLLNRIVGREAAIVSSEAGTTRDIVEIGVDLGGYFCRFGDTAGLRQAHQAASADRSPDVVINQIELEGMRRAKARAEVSDVVIIVLSFERNGTRGTLHIDPEVCSTGRRLIQEKGNVITVINKADLVDDRAARERGIHAVLREFPGLGKDSVHLISCMDCAPERWDACRAQSSDPDSIQIFLQGLIQRFAALTAALAPTQLSAEADPSVWQESLGASERHRGLLDACISHLDAFLLEVARESVTQHHDIKGGFEDFEADIVVAAEHLRFAADCLAKITGKGEAGDVEEVLGVVFEKFCVGK